MGILHGLDPATLLKLFGACVRQAFSFSPPVCNPSISRRRPFTQNENACMIPTDSISSHSIRPHITDTGEHYRSVLKTPSGTDHGNIRNMMTKGWKGVSFPNGLGLALKK